VAISSSEVGVQTAKTSRSATLRFSRNRFVLLLRNWKKNSIVLLSSLKNTNTVRESIVLFNHSYFADFLQTFCRLFADFLQADFLQAFCKLFADFCRLEAFYCFLSFTDAFPGRPQYASGTPHVPSDTQQKQGHHLRAGLSGTRQSVLIPTQTYVRS
jgi:hypothetical protein